MQINPGKYKGVAIAGHFTKSKEKGTPCVAILFQFDGDKQLWYQGWLTPASLERTIEMLVNIGYQEDKGHLPDGSIPEAHFTKTEVELVVANEEYTSHSGETKTSTKIKYVNKINSGFSSNPADVKAALAGVDIKAQMRAARAKLGLKVDNTPKPPKPPENDSIPF